MDLTSWLGANRRRTGGYGEDLQRRRGGKDTVLCAAARNTTLASVAMVCQSPLSAVPLAFVVLGASAAGTDDAQPRAVPGALVTDYHGVRIADPYRALEDVDAPATRAWAEAETAYTRAQLDRLPGLPALRRRIAALDADRAAQIRD